MQELKHRCAVITGGAGLLGRAMALRFAREGMNVVVSDLRKDAAEAVADEVRKLGVKAIGVGTDVANADSVDQLAERAYAEFGAVHLLCNNAGAVRLKPFVELTRDDWQLVFGVQFNGVLNGIQTFMPRLIAQGGESHIVNTSSMSGVGVPDMRQLNAPYVTAKFAVVGLTEVMAASLAEHNIGVSVLCPGFTVADPDGFDPKNFLMPAAAWYRDNLLPPEAVADEVVHGVRENRLHIFPHRAGRSEVQARHDKLMHAFDQAEKTSWPLHKR
ncbi:MAG: SDR family NAD(P)-dependent oxidoreductase [Spongiibacteraceae bacterium]